jgi:folylpolyglutamate synthase
MSTRTYRDAVDSLNSLQTNAAALEQVRASGGRSSAFAIPEMIEYLGVIGYKVRRSALVISYSRLSSLRILMV